MAEEVSLVFEAKTDQLVVADERLNKLNKTGKQTEQVQSRVAGSALRVAKSQKQLGGAFASSRQQVQNTAFQLQDIVVQLEAGVPVTRTLAQQLPQLLGGFGALGAVAGVVAGVTFALAGPLMAALGSTVDAVGDLEAALEELDKTVSVANDGVLDFSESLRALESVSRIAVTAQLTESIIQAEEAIDLAKNGIIDLTKEQGVFSIGFAKLIKQFESGEISARDLADAYDRFFVASGRAGENFREFRGELSKLVSGSEAAEAKLNRLNEAIAGDSLGTTEVTRDAENKQQEAIDREIQREQDKADRLADLRASQLNAEATAFQNRVFSVSDSLRTENEKYRDAYSERLATINAGEKKGVLLASEAAELRAKNEEKFNNQRLSQVGGFFGQVSSLTSSGNKKLFAIGKAAAIAQATIDGTLAIQKALTSLPPPANFAMAALVGASVGVNIANIASAKPPARAQGGQVRQGQAYTVGEFGPETFVPSSTGRILPTNQAANDVMRPVEVVNNIRVIGGNSNSQVTTQTTQQGDRRVIQDIVVDLMSNQSSPARQALHRTSNVTPRGQR